MTEVGADRAAMTFVIITGGIDLSVGSILGMTRDPARRLLAEHGPAARRSPSALALVVGTLAGFVNGVIITRFRVPPLIATLATLALYRGIAEGICPGPLGARLPGVVLRPRPGRRPGRARPSSGCSGLVALVAAVVLACTTWGRITLCHRLERGGGALLRPRGRLRTKIAIYTASGFAAALAA